MWALFLRYWPLLAVLALLAAAAGWYNHAVKEAVRDAVAVNDGKWEAEAAKLRQAAAEAALQQQRAVAMADKAAQASSDALEALSVSEKGKSNAYYQVAGNDGACLDDIRVRAIEKAGAAAMATATTPR